MGNAGVWLTSFRKVSIATVTFAVGALLKLLPTSSIAPYVWAGVGVFALVSIEEIFTNIRPAARLREAAPLAMDALASPILTHFKSKSIDARVSILKAVRTWKWLWLRRYFKVLWTKQMEDFPDVNISFPVSKGVSGQCFKSKTPIIAGPEDLKKYRLPRSIENEVRAVNLEVLLSYPLYEPKQDGWQSGKVIGVFNVDSLTPGAYAALNDGTVLGSIAADINMLR